MDLSPADLRRRAERRLKRKGGRSSGMSIEDVRGLVQELEVHQMELEIQNEELREAQLELANARDLYVDLYELAPVGYMTLDSRRVIRQANLSCAGLLCVDRESLIGTRLSKWLDPEDRDTCYLFLRETLEAGTTQNCDLRLRRGDGSTFWAGLEGVAVRDDDRDSTQLRVTLSDISARVEAEQTAERARQEKARTLALLDAIFDSAPIGIGFWDRDLRSVRVNDALAEMSGLPVEDHIGKRIDEILPGREAGTLESWQRIIRTGQPVTASEVVSETPARPGEKSHWLEGWYPVNAGGEVIGLAATFVDVTDRRRVQALLEAVLEQMPSGVYVGDASSGKLIMENREAANLLGHSTFETSGIEDYERFGALHPDGTPYKAEEYPIARVLLHGESLKNNGMRYRRGDGRIIELSINAAPVLGTEGELVAGMVVFHDVTAIKEAEEELRNFSEVLERRVEERTSELAESREKGRLREESIPHMVWSVLSDGTGEHFNRRTLDYLGKTTEEMNQLRWKDAVHPDDEDKGAKEWGEMTKAGREVFLELRILRDADGEYLWHLVQAVPMRDADGQIARWLGTCTDIHKRKLAEEALEASRQTLQKNGESLEHKNLALREILGQLEVEKRQIREDVATNMRDSVFPILDRLTFTEGNRLYVDMLRNILEDLAHPFGRKLSETAAGLTAREKEVCRMVHGGLSSKEVSELLGISLQTVEKHRKNIRKKLGLVDSGSTLGTYLSQL